jgi:hypothetical protein
VGAVLAVLVRAVLVVVVVVVLPALEAIIGHDLLAEGCASNLLYFIHP